MQTDSLSRRLRHAPPAPNVARLVLTEADLSLFEAIDRHGPLPSHYLFAFVQPLRRDYSHFQHRMTAFFNGNAQGPYLIRPRQQFASFEARYQHLVYDLADRARLVLAERGTLNRFSPKRTDPFLHRFMGACVGASIELAARAKGLRYIAREQILAHPKCPDSTRDAANPLAIGFGHGGKARLVPDDLFGLEYPGRGFRFFAVEIDRQTESIARKANGQSGFARKVAAYADILREGRHAPHWGVPNLTVLSVTTNANHALNLSAYVRAQVGAELAGRFAFTSASAFGANWRVPRTLLTQLLQQPWITPAGQRTFDEP